jgi:hypothetical protein
MAAQVSGTAATAAASGTGATDLADGPGALRLSLRGLISVERGSSEGAAFLRQRLALCCAALAAMSGAFGLVATALGVTQFGFSLRDELTRPGNQWHAAQVAIFVLTWIVCRTTKPSARAIEWLDAINIIGACTCHAMMTYVQPSGAHPALDVGGLLGPNPPAAATANVVALVARSILVPSGPGRTLLVGVLSTAPMVIGSAVLQHQHPGPQGMSFFFGSVLWSLLTAALAPVVSSVTYRLERQAERARALGQYVLERKIGEGGMGIVYRARHVLLQRPTALKVLPPEKTGEHAIARFEREVQATSRLTHPNTISIYDYGRTADGVFYYAMELLDGVDLDRLVRITGPLPPARVVHVLAQICGALTEAHDLGLIHRDIKPANVFLCRQGGIADVAKVLDFGLVRALGGASGFAHDGAGSDGLMGTPLYLPPEGITRSSRMDARSDLYALGCTACFLLTGHPPFQGGSMVEVCAKHLHTPFDPESLRSAVALPPGLEQILIACLEKDPARRPAGARDVASALRVLGRDAPWTEDEASGWWSANQARLALDSGDDARGAAADDATAGMRLSVDLTRRVADPPK